jgi:hypothetical protein
MTNHSVSALHPLECYDLKAEQPNWQLAFDAKLSLYSKRGLQDFLTYLDGVLAQAGAGPGTVEKYQAKRDEVAYYLELKMTPADMEDEISFAGPATE